MFNQKEEGYDEFVAECIRKGLSELDQGLGYTPEEFKMLAEQLIARKAREIEEFEQENLKYA